MNLIKKILLRALESRDSDYLWEARGKLCHCYSYVLPNSEEAELLGKAPAEGAPAEV